MIKSMSYGLISCPLLPTDLGADNVGHLSAISVAFFALSGIAAQLLNALGLEGEWQRTG